MPHSKDVVQKGGKLFHKSCVGPADDTMDVSQSTLDKDDMCAECDDPLLVVASPLTDSADDMDDDDDDEG